LNKNTAEVDSMVKVQQSQAEGYGTLKNNLGLTNEQLMSYIKSKLIKNYSGGNLALNLESPETKK
jgi:hypothetical protein